MSMIRREASKEKLDGKTELCDGQVMNVLDVLENEQEKYVRLLDQ